MLAEECVDELFSKSTIESPVQIVAFMCENHTLYTFLSEHLTLT